MQSREHFLRVRELTIVGYFTSETVGKTVLHYDPIPGRYDGCIPLAEVVLGPALSDPGAIFTIGLNYRAPGEPDDHPSLRQRVCLGSGGRSVQFTGSESLRAIEETFAGSVSGTPVEPVWKP